MKKIFEFGKVDYNGSGRKINLVEVEVELEERGSDYCFSVMGNIWNTRKTDTLCGGQCLDEIKVFENQLRDPKLFNVLWDLWKRFHLNNLHAGTVEQEAEVEKFFEVTEQEYDYSKACEHLKQVGLFEVEYNGKPYKYGYSWITFPIPENDLGLIKSLIEEG